MNSAHCKCNVRLFLYHLIFWLSDSKYDSNNDSSILRNLQGFATILVDLVMILATSGQHSYNIRTRFLNYADKNLITYGQDSYNTRTTFLNYADKIPELSGQRWHLI